MSFDFCLDNRFFFYIVPALQDAMRHGLAANLSHCKEELMGAIKKLAKSLRWALSWMLADVISRQDGMIQQIRCLQQRVDALSQKKYSDPKRLEPFGYKVYSQNDEDGIIAEIFRRIGTTNRFFIEFGVQDGLESNTHFLLLQGWSGVFIEGSERYCKAIREKFKLPLEQGRLTALNEFITVENINALFAKTKAIELKEIDLLSIDIDGNDYHVFKAIDSISPRVVIVEFNSKFPPPMEWIMPYNPSFVWDKTDNHGASLQALANLGQAKGYRLVGTNINGVDAFFVREDLCGDKFCQASAAELYNPSEYSMLFPAGHKHKTARYLGNAALGEGSAD